MKYPYTKVHHNAIFKHGYSMFGNDEG